MATRQQLTDAIDDSLLSILKHKGDLRAREMERVANAISQLVYARGDILRQGRESREESKDPE